MVPVGYRNKLLVIRLDKKKSEEKPIKTSLGRELIGGKGFGAYFLLKYTKKNTDPFDPSNVLIMASGPLNATKVPIASKLGFFFKSPMTNGYGESYVGGSIPKYPKWIGYDVVIITGKAPKPTYIIISDEGVEFIDAKELWGKTTIETDNILKKRHGKNISVACIGPAGERMVRYACICIDKWRQAGRCGAGAVMGSKNLKAIVFTGEGDYVDPANPVEFEGLLGELWEKIRESKGVKRLREYGTSAMVPVANEMGFFPTKYWTHGTLDKWENIGPESIKSILIRPNPCWNCPIACGRYIRINTRWGEIEIDGPEYETIYSMGGLFCVNKLEDLVYLNYLADAFGMDTITLGNILGLAVEASKRGKIKLEIDYGNINMAVNLIKMIAYRKDIGNLFAEGVKRVAEVLGLDNIAIEVKGLEPAGYDPRVLRGMAIAYATSPRGACHLRTMAYMIDIKKLAGDPEKIGEEKVLKIVEYEQWMTSFDCLIMCKFGRYVVDMETMLKLYNAATGHGLTMADYVARLKNVILLTRYFNEREGFTRKEDTLPARFFSEPIGHGDKKYLVDRDEFEWALDKYYEKMEIEKDGKISEAIRKKIFEFLQE